MPRYSNNKTVSRRIAVITLILLVQAGLTYSSFWNEADYAIPAIHEIPSRLSEWQVLREYELETDVVNYLKPDAYISRQYLDRNDSSPMELFVAYFRSLKSGYGPHSPKHCLPGSGWLTRSTRAAPLFVPGRDDAILINEYVLEKAGQEILVLYWYQNDRHLWADEVMAKVYLLPDLIRYKRSDIALVRIITPVKRNGLDHANKSGSAFARALFPYLETALGAGSP